MNIALVGNPNVGKSSLFTRLTGTKITCANFPGTTVRITRGTVQCPDRCCEKKQHTLLDAPGIYSLDESSDYTTVAARIIADADIIINVIDATHLERNLYLTTELGRLKKPLVVALNLWDEARYHGISIDHRLLSRRLGIPIIPTVSLTGQGTHALVSAACTTRKPTYRAARLSTWDDIATLAHTVEHRTPLTPSWKKRLERLTIQPVTGVLCAITILIATFILVSFLGEYAEDALAYLFATTLTTPLLALHNALSFSPFLQQFLIGTVHGTHINYAEAMGMLTSGIFIPLAKVAPVVTIFYTVLGLLEDCGYLPRLAVLSDSLMHHFALHGFAVLPMILGAGCSVTGIASTSILPNKRQQMIASLLLATTIPCTSQTAVILSLFDKIGLRGIVGIFATLIATWYLLGRLLGSREKQSYRELLLEIPPYRIPRLSLLLPRLYARLKTFFAEAIPITIAGIGILILCNYFSVFTAIGALVEAPLSYLLGLPAETIPILIMGLFRKEIALSFLHAITLTPSQIITCTLMLSVYFPCISVYTILYRQFGWKTLIRMLSIMCTLALLLGFSSRLVLQQLG